MVAYNVSMLQSKVNVSAWSFEVFSVTQTVPLPRWLPKFAAD